MSNLRQGLKKLKAKGLKKGSKKKFPDLSGDGKVTQKDILIGRGVVKKAVLGKAITTGAKAIAKKKGKSKKEINKMFDEVKNAKAQKLTKKEKIILPAAKIAAPIGIAAGAYGLNETYKGMKSIINAEKTLKAVDKAFSKKTKRKEKKNISQADIIGKGSPKGRAQGGPAPSSKKSKDKTTTQDILHGKERELKKKPKKKKDLIDEIQPDRIFTPGVKGPLRKVSKGGMMIKGQGAAIRGTKFKGTF
tara:strand:- start:464 stop:1204 length:741 start_codon:yes stop_codon:yes gene_type:complete